MPSHDTTTTNFVYDPWTSDNIGGALHAIKEINNKSDGVWDELLPDTAIVYEWYNSGMSAETAMQQAVLCVTTAFGGTKADVVLGAAFSGPTINSQLVLANYDVPQLSHSATSPALSASSEYPTFFRTVPSDAYQGLAAADVIKHVFGWTNGILVLIVTLTHLNDVLVVLYLY